MTMATTDDTRRLVTDLKRLLHRMEVYNPSDLSSYSLRGRATMAQERWAELEQLQDAFPDDGTGATQLRERVQMACRKAEEFAVKKKETEIDWVDEIFFKPTRQEPAKEPVVDESDDDAESVAEESQEERQPAQPRAQEPRRHEGVEALQKEQREQLESEISHMAAQLKASTQHMNSTLKSQTDNLQEMEDLATENVDKVGKAADSVQEHNKKAWGSTIATWTLMLTIFGTFLFCMITIRLAPKRANTSLPCLVNCQSQEKSLQERALERMEDLKMKRLEMEKESKKMEEEVTKHEEAERLEKEAQQRKEEDAKKAHEEEDARRRSEEEIARKTKQEELRHEQATDARAAAAAAVGPKETVVTPEEKIEANEHNAGDDDDDDDDDEEDLQAASERLRKQAEAARQVAEQRKFEAEEKIRQKAEATRREGEKRRFEAEEGTRQETEAARKKEEESKLEAKKRKQERNDSINERNQEKIRLAKEEKKRVGKERRDAGGKKNEEERIVEERRKRKEEQRKDEEQKAKKSAVESENTKKCGIYDDCIDEGENTGVKADSGEAVCLDGECAASEGPGSDVSDEESEDFAEIDLHNAALHGDLNALRRYLDRRPELATHTDENGWQLIHEASDGGHVAIVDFLLQLPNVDVNARTGSNGGNALWRLRNLSEDHPVVKSLKAAGAQPLAPVEPDRPPETDPGFTVMDVLRAAHNGDNKALSRYVDDKPDWINIADPNGWTPLHEAIRNQHAGTVSWIAERGGKLNLRTGKGDGWSPLGMAIDLYGADHAISKFLQRMGAEDIRPEK